MRRTLHIVNNSEFDLELYERLDFVRQNKKSLDRLRTLLSFINPKNYKGIGRTTFTAEPYYLNTVTQEISTWPDIPNLSDQNILAKHKILDIEKQKNETDKSDFYFEDSIELNSVFELLTDKINYEKIEITLEQPALLPDSYGFDIGYWCGDFSIIADTAIKPTWHPPNLDNMSDLDLQLKKLNNHCLFDSYDDALDYKNLYLSKEWAEENWHENANDKEGDIKIVLVRPA
jgi:hypothetical protein